MLKKRQKERAIRLRACPFRQIRATCVFRTLASIFLQTVLAEAIIRLAELGITATPIPALAHMRDVRASSFLQTAFEGKPADSKAPSIRDSKRR